MWDGLSVAVCWGGWFYRILRERTAGAGRLFSLKDYWLRVPTTMETAHEAVAWTFGKTVDEYRPEIET